MRLVNTVWTSVGLLNTTFESAVRVDAADPVPRKLTARAFETLPPSIGVVHVNKPLVISKRGGRTTCWKMPGHDRRQHKRTYRKSGRTIIVPAIKVNGGTNGPMVKRVKIDQPL